MGKIGVQVEVFSFQEPLSNEVSDSGGYVFWAALPVGEPPTLPEGGWQRSLTCWAPVSQILMRVRFHRRWRRSRIRERRRVSR